MSGPRSATNLSLTRITDVHIHVQPWRELKPNVLETMWKSHGAERDLMIQVMDDPRALLEVMDRAGVWRAGLVNYPSPDVMGFTDATNAFAAKYAQADPERLLPYGGVHPRFTKDPAGDVDRLAELGIRLVKIHPPHQGMPAARLLQYFPRLSELADRVLWGTDWPSPGVTDMRINIDQFLALPLSDPHKRAILETNALALFPAAR